MRSRLLLPALASVLPTVLLLHCAGQAPPQGGPSDTTPPLVVATSPDTNATRVETDEVTLEFSEYVDRRSVEEALFISPYVGPVEFDWSGPEVTVKLSRPLKNNRTYVVNVGTDVVDRRGKNRMASGFTLAFSTGDSIDQGFISGAVVDEKPEGVMIFAYLLDGRDRDTLNPTITEPDYIMQTGARGGFTLANIAFGAYRVIAVRDEFRDRLYQKEVDQYGVAAADVEVTAESPRRTHLLFRLSREDTSRPFLTAVEPESATRLRIRFSEPLDSASVAPGGVVLTDTMSRTALPVSLTYQDRVRPAELLVCFGLPLEKGRGYRLETRGLSDRRGNPLDSSRAGEVVVSQAEADTLPPEVSVAGLRDTLQRIAPDEPLAVSFSEAVNRRAAEGAFTLEDSAGVTIPVHGQWLGPADYLLRFSEPLRNNAPYRFIVVCDSLQDLQGNSRSDSTLVFRLRTLDIGNTGVIEGSVKDESGDTSALILSAIPLGGSATPRSVRLAGTTRFAIERLPEGRYTLWVFRDTDGSGTYSYGLPYPFVPAERFAVYQDTLKVRARWNVEGVGLVLGK